MWGDTGAATHVTPPTTAATSRAHPPILLRQLRELTVADALESLSGGRQCKECCKLRQRELRQRRKGLDAQAVGNLLMPYFEESIRAWGLAEGLEAQP